MNASIATTTLNGGSLHPVVPHHGRTHLDLFSGIGGFALAAASAGYTTIGFSEIEPYACKILKRHWPDVPNHGDIRNIRGVRADLVTGGFPCQPYSLAGERRGASDDRALWPEMLRVIDDAKPEWVLGENVAGIITLELDRVLSDLEGIGYAAWPLVIPACALDARHRRDRVWIVAHSESNCRGRGLCETGTEQDWNQPANGGALLADADETGRREQRRAEPMASEHAAAECGGEDVSHANGRQHESGGARPNQRTIPRADESGWCRWPAEPGVGRVANGIPNRTHRLRGLGNAIVPQVASEILQTLVMGNDQAEASGARGRPIANPDAPAALPPARG